MKEKREENVCTSGSTEEASAAASGEELWMPVDLLYLQCYDVSKDTLAFLTEKGFTSVQQLKSESISSLDSLFTIPPMVPSQIFQIFKLREAFRNAPVLSTGAYNIAMTKPHMEAIKINLELLIQMIEVETLLEKMQAYKMLTDKDISKIAIFESESDRARKLFEIMPKKQDICFLFFLQSLRDTGQGHVSDMLEKSLCDEPIPGLYTYGYFRKSKYYKIIILAFKHSYACTVEHILVLLTYHINVYFVDHVT